MNLGIDSNQFIVERTGKVTKDYQILNLLGKGGFGEVKKVKHKLTGDIRAMKIIKKNNLDEQFLTSL